MVVHLLIDLVVNGPPGWLWRNRYGVLYSALTLAILALIKWFASGRSNPAERLLHGKVVLLTGGTSGVGARIAHNLASRGAQIVLLTHTSPADPFLAEFIQDLRDKYDNHLIYAEQVDLSSLHSIRKFATKWIDNAPPRRLDAIILCAATLTPTGGERKETEEGIEETWMVNFLANFHLLGILSPAIRAQPMDRDVRIIISTCSSYIGAPSLKTDIDDETWTPSVAYARSKLALNVFSQAFQKHLDAYKRPDGVPMNARVICVDPGLSRTPGTRRWLTRGTLTGLALYMIGYFVPWLLLKSPEMGAQSFLYAIMESALGRGDGGKLVKECQVVDYARPEVHDEEVAKKLWEESDALIERVEKSQAKKRAVQRAEKDKAEKAEKSDKSDKERSSKKKEDKERLSDVESLLSGRSGRRRSKDKDRDDTESIFGGRSRKKDKSSKEDRDRLSDVESLFSGRRRSKDKDRDDTESIFGGRRKTKDKDKERSKDKDKEKKKKREKEKEREKDKDRDSKSDEGRSRRRSKRSDS